MTRRLQAFEAAPAPPLLSALEDALDGRGPAVLPVPADDAATRDRTIRAVRPEEPLESDDIAAVVATSGSTGEPKGVLLTTSGLRASAEATHARIGGPGRWLLALSPVHVAGLQVLVRSVLAGTSPVAMPAGSFEPRAFAEATAGLGPGRRYTSLVPTQLVRVLDAGGAAVEAAASYDVLLLGGAAATGTLLERARAAGIRVVTTYGMSETSGGCVYDGRALDGVSVELDDSGRILLSGPVLAAGYRLRPDLTAESFAGDRFRTSDLGRIGPDGRLAVLGRADDVIVTGGEKVAAAAVEDALASCDGVREAAVVGSPDPEWGQRVVAYVVPTDPSSPPAPDVVRRQVADRLGRAAAPREVRLVAALPLLPSGKVDRLALAKQ
jgi:O-succinylbenzoic acid--CoA ligase